MATAQTAVLAPEPAEASGPDRLVDLLSRRELRAVFQPIVDLRTRHVAGYEALARGPAGTEVERPDRLFAEARRQSLVAELDAACQQTALAAATEGGLAPPATLFLNSEPEALVRSGNAPALPSSGPDRPAVVVELTERALTERPAELLRAVARLRTRGCGIALDDVGADSRSLALMPFVSPDVIKLDLRLVHSRPTAEVAAIVTAVTAEAERSGATILAEGIETEDQVAAALAMGADLGQGWLLGRPGPLPAPLPRATAPISIRWRVDGDVADVTPYELVSGSRRVRRATKALLLRITRQLEEQALTLGEATVVLSTFQAARHFTPATGRRYRRLAERAALVGALGEGLESVVVEGVRGAALHRSERLAGEWDLVVLGPHFAAALVARDLGDTGPDPERRFDFALTYDREFVVDIARCLMSRVAPLDEAQPASG